MAEWPCCHDPLRFSPMSLRFVPPFFPSPILSPNIGAEATTAHPHAPRRRKKSSKSPDRPAGRVLLPKEIPSPEWPPTTPKGNTKSHDHPHGHVLRTKEAPRVPNSEKKNERWPMSLKLCRIRKINQKNTKRHPMPPKLSRIHLRIVLSLPTKNQVRIPAVAW